MDLVGDLLDKQLVDRRGARVGRVDGLVLEVRRSRPPRVAWNEIGGVTLARRLHPRLARWVARWARRLSPTRGTPFRIPLRAVRDIGITVTLEMDAEGTPADVWERWIRRHVVGRIPGAGKAS